MGFDIAKKIQFVLDLKDDDKVKTGIKGVSDGLLDAERAASLASKAFIALVGVGSIAALTSMVKGSIDAAAGLHDLSISTGLSVAALQQFRSVGAYTGTTAEDIASASNKLAKNLALTTEEGKGAAVALKAMGVDFDSFKKLNPEQQMLEVAKAMGGFADGSEKSAAAMLLYGREGAKLLPFLADLAKEHDDIEGKLTDTEKALRANQAAMADAFGDNLTAIRKESEGWKKDLSMGLLPALWEASEAVLGMGKGTGGLKAEISRLAKDGTLAEWARGAITAFTYLIDVGQGLYNLLKIVGTAVAGVFAAGATAAQSIEEARTFLEKGDLAGWWNRIKTGAAAAGQVMKDTGTDIATIWGEKLLGEKFRDRMADLKGTGMAAQEARPRMANLADVAARLADGDGKAARARQEHNQQLEAAVKAGDKLLETTELELLQMQQQADLGRELTAGEKALLKLEEELKNSRVVLTKSEYELVRARIASTQELRDEERWLHDTTRANEEATRAIRAHRDDLQRQIDAQRQANDAIGLTGRALEEHRAAVDEDRAALLERRAALLQEVDPAIAEELRNQAAQVRELAKARLAGFDKAAAVEAANAWIDQWKRVGAGMYDAIKGGWGSIKDFLLKSLEDIFLRGPITQWLSGLGAQLGGWIGSQLGIPGMGGGGAAVAGVVQGASGLGNLFGGGGGAGLAGVGSAIGAFGNAAGYGFGSVMGGNLTGAFTGGAQLIGAGNVAEGLGSIIGGAGPYAVGAAALVSLINSLDPSGTPHTGGYARSNGSTVVDITAQQGGIQDAATQQLVAQFAAQSAGMLNETAKALGKDVQLALEAVFESQGSGDGSWGLFRALLDGKALPGGFVDQGTLAADRQQGFTQFVDETAAAMRDALAALDLPQWAAAKLESLGTAPTYAELSKTLEEVRKQAEQPLAGTGAAGDATTAVTDSVDALLEPSQATAEAVARTADSTERTATGVAGLINQVAELAAATQAMAKQLEQWTAFGMPTRAA